MEMHKVEDKNRGSYTVDGALHPKKDLQLVKGNVIKAPRLKHNKNDVIYKIREVNHSKIQR